MTGGTATPASGSRRGGLAAAGAIALLTAAVFARVVWHDAIVYDDPEYVFDNPRVLDGLTPGGLTWAFTSLSNGNWHPLTWLSHMLDVQLFGVRPGLHHLSSVLLHATTSVALFFVLRGMTGALVRSALVAALFAVHPLHVQSVAWIAERKDVLSGLLWVLALAAYLRHARAPGPRSLIPVVGTFALGLMAKPMLVTLPVILLLLDHWPLGRLRPGSWSGDLARLCREKAPLFALSALSAVVTLVAQKAGHALSGLDQIPAVARGANTGIAYLRYIDKAFFPRGLSVFYPHDGSALRWWTVLGSLALLALVTAGACRTARRRGYLLVGWSWYLVALLPVIGIVQVGAQGMADRYTYLPLIGLFVAVIWLGHDVAARGRLVVAAGASAALALLSFSVLAFRETGFWRDSLTLFEHSSASVPRNTTLLSLKGTYLLRQGRIAEAVPVLREAVSIAPGEPNLHYNLASALARQGDFEASAIQYRASLVVQPDDAGARVALADVLARLGNTGEALRELDAALALEPENPVTHRDLSLLLERLGDVNRALEHASRNAGLQPADSRAHLRLGVLLARAERFDEALAEFQRAAVLAPENADALYNIGLVFDLQGDPARAIDYYRRALDLDPASALAHNSLGAVLMDQGRRSEAVAHFEEALRLAPDSLEAQANLARAMRSR